MAIAVVDNSSPTSGDLNDEAWDAYNATVAAILTQHDTAGAHKAAGDVVLKALFDANTILYATTDDTPAALTVAASRIVGRASSGAIAALTAAQVLTLIGVESGATADQTEADILTLLGLTTGEVDQVGAIGATTISTAQWGYLGACVAGGGQLMAALTASESTQLEAIGATTISAAQWVYLGGMNQDVITTSTVQFAKLGLGTSTIPHGGEGSAMLALDGADNSPTLGPHVQLTTVSDNYPLMQLYMRQHDLIYFYFDAYFDGAHKSSDAGSNFQLKKESDKFFINYDSGVAQGAEITWNNGIELDTSGQVTIANLAGTGNRAVYVDTNGKLYEGAGV